MAGSNPELAAITLGEEEVRFLNFLSAAVPAMPDFERILRRAVVEVARIIPLDAYAIAVRTERGANLSICAVRSVGDPFLAAVREDMTATCRSVFPDCPTTAIETDTVVLSTEPGGRAERPAAHEFHRVESLAPGIAGMFRADRAGFEPKDFFLFTLLSNWLASYHVLASAYRRMEELSITDPLTGVSNRRKFTEELEREIERLRRYRFDLSVLLVDVDRLKEINDTHGHLAGDLVLRQAVQSMLQITRKVDLVARLGGDEFAVLLPHTSAEGAATVASRLVERCGAAEVRYEDRCVRFSVSVGAATVGPAEDAKALLARVDGALYEAKHSGRNTVRTSKPPVGA
jgi:diguanylate cyclase (GGDEF)-like protein